jgi:hypothetical protein
MSMKTKHEKFPLSPAKEERVAVIPTPGFGEATANPRPAIRPVRTSIKPLKEQNSES